MTEAPARNRDIKDYALFVVAWCYLALAWITVRFLPFRLICRWMAKPAKASQAALPPERIILAIRRAAVRTPWRSVCIHQGVAAQRMLRRAGHHSQFVYGISSSSEALQAHVWVRLNGLSMIGEDAVPDFEEVMALPR